MKYTEIQIQSVLQLLNQIGVNGIDNCKRICMIEQILQHPEKGDGEKENGDCSKKE